MNVLSQENIDKIEDEISLISMTLASIEQQKNMLIMEFGMQQMQSVINDLRAERLKLQMKAVALRAYLTQ